MNYDFTELFKLEKLCRGAGWKVEVLDTYPKGKQLILYDGERRLDDVVICQGSHGANLGFLESFVLGDCVGYETAQQIFAGWKELFNL